MRFKAGAFLVEKRWVWKYHGGDKGAPLCPGVVAQEEWREEQTQGSVGEEASRQTGAAGRWGDVTSQMQGGVSTQILVEDVDNTPITGSAVTHQVSGCYSRWTVSGG